MQVVSLDRIKAVLDESAALETVEHAFRRYAAGEAQVTAVGHLQFASPPGDCHVKSGAFNGDPVFVIKIATGFYRHPENGLPVGNGLMVVMSALRRLREVGVAGLPRASRLFVREQT